MSMRYYYRTNTRNMNRARVDVIEADDSYIVRADVPGYTKEELTIEADFETLKISAEREINEENIKFIHRERVTNKISRTVTFAKPVNPNAASVKLDLGVLEITLPFSEEAKTVKLIPEVN